MRTEVARDRAVAMLARTQHGVVTATQLDAAGFSEAVIRRRVDGGWLVRRHQGVYQLGVVPARFGDEMAALLAVGPRAALSHSTSVGIWTSADVRGPVELICEGEAAGHRAGIRPHRTAALDACDVAVRHGLRVTTPARTLVDLAATTPPAELERLVEEMQVQGLASPAEILEAIRRGAGRPGVRKLRAVADLLDEPLFTRSEAERRLRALLKTAALPMPRTNVKRAGWEVDAVWDRRRLVVEVDGYRYHRTRAKFERDRRRDGQLLLAGYRVLRITWRQLTREPETVVATIAAALATQ
jgi:very-short-patch-repair endonuclease